MEEPERYSEPPRAKQQDIGSKSKKTIASILCIGIIFGFLFILFAVIIIIINLIPAPNKLNWLLTEATVGNWVLLVGVGLLLFFFALVVCAYIWKKGRGWLLARI